MKAETVTFTTTVEIADADGLRIREGSVLREIETGDTGVVAHIVREGERIMCIFPAIVGDLHIRMASWVIRVSNRYKKWRHVPHDEQTYEQRFESWRCSKDEPVHGRESLSPGERLAIDGIMALLPNGVVNWENGPWPDTTEDALRFLSEHLSALKERSGCNKK